MGIHDSNKSLANDFSRVWEKLHNSDGVALCTPAPHNHDFEAKATITTRGQHEGEKVILIFGPSGKEFARIYSCCWGHTTNCSQARIGGYSDALDQNYTR
jgi:hypothetical protein